MQKTRKQQTLAVDKKKIKSAVKKSPDKGTKPAQPKEEKTPFDEIRSGEKSSGG